MCHQDLQLLNMHQKSLAKNPFAKYKPKQWNIGRVRCSQSFVPFSGHWEETG
ncbi:hypothetical protein T09_3421 [Trichinella sp. T9]|nr:hypothetical protein T09_3421 [Trichinella sp. T9]